MPIVVAEGCRSPSPVRSAGQREQARDAGITQVKRAPLNIVRSSCRGSAKPEHMVGVVFARQVKVYLMKGIRAAYRHHQ